MQLEYPCPSTIWQVFIARNLCYLAQLGTQDDRYVREEVLWYCKGNKKDWERDHWVKSMETVPLSCCMDVYFAVVDTLGCFKPQQFPGVSHSIAT